MARIDRLLKLADIHWDSKNSDEFSRTIVAIAGSKSEPNDSELWSRVKQKAKGKFDVWPSAYGSAWASKEYKRLGGTWKKSSKAKDSEDQMFLGDLKNIQEYGLKTMHLLEEMPEDQVPEWVESKITQARQHLSEVYHYFEDHHFLDKEAKVHNDSGLGKWFKEKWVDVSKKDKSGKHPPCGRSGDKKGGYPKCRPSKKVDESTPETSKSMSKKEKESATSQKRQTESKSKSSGKGRKPNYDSHSKKD